MYAQVFLRGNPQLEDYEPELMKFAAIEAEVDERSGMASVGPIGLDTAVFCSQLRQVISMWRHQYSDRLHTIAQAGVCAPLCELQLRVPHVGVRVRIRQSSPRFMTLFRLRKPSYSVQWCPWKTYVS